MIFTLPDAVESTTIQIFWSWAAESQEEIWQKRLSRSGWRPLLQGEDTKDGWKKSRPSKKKILKDKHQIPDCRQAGAGRQMSSRFAYRNAVIESFVIKSFDDPMTE